VDKQAKQADAPDNTTLGSIGLLGAALLNDVDPAELACAFPGSKRRADPPADSGRPADPRALRCAGPGGPLQQILNANHERPNAPVRVRFSVPDWKPDKQSGVYDENAKILCDIPADQLSSLLKKSPDRVCGRTEPLARAVVMIGGSYLASGDLRATPLNARVPGALIHLNAIRAFAQSLSIDKSTESTGWVLTEEHRWLGLPECLVIAVAAFIGAVMHTATGRLSRRRIEWGAALINLAMSLGGTAIEVLAILWITIWMGEDRLLEGNAIEILTPPLSIALEGLSVSYYYLRELVECVVASAFRLLASAFKPERAEPRSRTTTR
ncbi:MAG: hypothetical protein JOZ16_17295, partial [Methylobacteriaceae bacterium]|nr:hypothetical protein [Methylobacteriaceae bacterium]